MRRWAVLTLYVLAACSDTRGQAPSTGNKFLRAASPIAGRYIVVLNDEAGVAREAEQLTSRFGGKIEAQYHHALRGFVLAISEDQARSLATSPSVKYVEQDGVVMADATVSNPPWTLDRVDQRLPPLDHVYQFSGTGFGVHAYVFDSGIRHTHSEFTGGRAELTFSAINDGNGLTDCHGHGTHVAALLGGATVGMARGVRLHSMRVLGCDATGSTSGVLAALDWLTQNHAKPAVANLSLGGSLSQALDDAVARAISAGVTFILSAGNDNMDACLRSPTRVSDAITVGAAGMDDARYPLSNFGSCVDLFAPGVQVESAWHASDTATKTLSGSSMAAPLVAGMVALVLERNPAAAPAAVADALGLNATAGALTGLGPGSPNRLLYTGFLATPSDDKVPSIAISSPSPAATVAGRVKVQVSASDLPPGAVRWVELSVDGKWVATDSVSPFELSWDTRDTPNGVRALRATAVDLEGNVAQSAPVSVTVANAASALYDAALGVPSCRATVSRCDTGLELVFGRGPVGPEPGAPNTLQGTCMDGAMGLYGASPSIERVHIERRDGTPFAKGKLVKVEVTAWISSTATERLDLFVATDATNPNWSWVDTIVPVAPGLQTLTAEYVLRSAGLVALRAALRSSPIIAPCPAGDIHDRDDVALFVGSEPDSTAPKVSVTEPVSGAVLRGVVSLTAKASDNFGVERVEFFVDSVLVGKDYQPPFRFDWQSRDVSNGPHVLAVAAYDVAGHRTDATSIVFTTANDFNAPAVAVLTPADGATVRDVVDVHAVATDDVAIERVELLVNGTVFATDHAAPFVAPWNSRAHVNGKYVLQARAVDSAGNEASSPAVTVIADNDFTAPSITLLSPAPGSTLTGTVTARALASDDVAVSRVEFWVDGRLASTDPVAPFEWVWETTAWGNGSYPFVARAYDAAGNASSTPPLQVTVNNAGIARLDPAMHAPACAKVGPSCDSANLVDGRAHLGPERNAPNTLFSTCQDGGAGTYHVEESIDRLRVLREDGTDLAGGKRVRVDVTVWAPPSIGADRVDVYYAADAGAPSWTHVATLTPTKAGAQTLSTDLFLKQGALQAVRAAMRFGGSASPCLAGGFNDRDDLVFAVSTAPDVQPPTVGLISPLPNTLVRGSASVAALATDDFDVTHVVLFVGTTLVATDSNPPYELVWNTRAVPNGAHSLTARAHDFAGNASASPPVLVIVDNDLVPPHVTLFSPVATSVSGLVTLHALATDNEEVRAVELLLDKTVLAVDSTAPYELVWDTASHHDGVYKLTARATDVQGNVAVSVAVDLTVNNLARRPVKFGPAFGP